MNCNTSEDEHVISQSGGDTLTLDNTNFTVGNISMPSALKASGGPILTSGLNSTNEWSLVSYQNKNSSITMATNSAPILIVWPLTANYGGNTTYDGQIADVVDLGAKYGGWGMSYAYIPSGTNSLTIPASYGVAIFHGDRQFNHKLSSITADRDGYVFIFSSVVKSYVSSIKKNGVEIKNDVLADVSSTSTGWGMSFATIPVVVGDEITISNSYEYAVIY